MEPTQHEIKLLVAAAISVGIKNVFKSHVYQFGGRIYQQIVGGPIGLRMTAVVARIRMARWIRVVIAELKKAGLTVWVAVFYVDDVRIVCSSLPMGWK